MPFSKSVVDARVASAVLENIGFTVYRQDNRAFIGMRLVEGAHPPPHELAGAADTVMIVERAFDHIGLLDLGMLMNR
jgi:hypothetical protein